MTMGTEVVEGKVIFIKVCVTDNNKWMITRGGTHKVKASSYSVQSYISFLSLDLMLFMANQMAKPYFTLIDICTTLPSHYAVHPLSP